MVVILIMSFVRQEIINNCLFLERMCKRPFFFIFLFGLLFTLYFFVFSTVTHLDSTCSVFLIILVDPNYLSLDHYQCISKTVESDVLHENALNESSSFISSNNEYYLLYRREFESTE